MGKLEMINTTLNPQSSQTIETEFAQHRRLQFQNERFEVMSWKMAILKLFRLKHFLWLMMNIWLYSSGTLCTHKNKNADYLETVEMKPASLKFSLFRICSRVNPPLCCQYPNETIRIDWICFGGWANSMDHRHIW